MRIYPVLLVIFLAITALPSFAETRQERLKVASEYLEATLADVDMQALIEQMWKPVVQNIEKSGKKLSDEKISSIRTLYSGTFTEPMFELMRGQKEIMADTFSLTEIIALKEFYISPVGRSVMKKLPQLIGSQQPAIMKMVQAKIPAVIEKIEIIIAE